MTSIRASLYDIADAYIPMKRGHPEDDQAAGHVQLAYKSNKMRKFSSFTLTGFNVSSSK
jgi:hypothetical protein